MLPSLLGWGMFLRMRTNSLMRLKSPVAGEEEAGRSKPSSKETTSPPSLGEKRPCSSLRKNWSTFLLTLMTR